MANKYWVGPGGTATTPTSGNFSSAGAWRTTSGGTTTTSTPGTGDVAIFDNNSFNGLAITVTVSAAVTVGSIDASGITTGANGITLAGTFQLTLSNGSGTGSLIKLPSSRFTWAHSGTLSLNGATGVGPGTIETNNIPIASNVSLAVTSPAAVLLGNFNGTGTLTQNSGTLNLGNYQWICSRYTSTGAGTATIDFSSASGGITVTANSGTVITVTKIFSNFIFPNGKPIFTLTASSSPSGRDITWTGASWATSASTMPGFKITNGSDTVTITQTASQPYYNLASLNTTGFSGTLQYTNSATQSISVYGDFINPATATLLFNSNVYFYGTGNSFSLTSTESRFFFTSGSVYTQVGNINAGFIGGTFTTGSLTLNNTGILSGGFNVPGVTLVGAISVDKTGINGINLASPIVTSLTSITISETTGSDTGKFTFSGGTYPIGVTITINDSADIVFSNNATVNGPVNFVGPNTGIVEFRNSTINGVLTLSSASQLIIENSTVASVLTVTTTKLVFTSGTVNIPSTSVFTVNAVALQSSYESGATFTNKFRINLNAPTGGTGTTSMFNTNSGSNNDPDVYLNGTGTYGVDGVVFGNGVDINKCYFSSLDMTGYSVPGQIDGYVYIKNSLVQSANSVASVYMRTSPGQTGTLTLNASNIGVIDPEGTSSLTIDVTSSSLKLGVYNSNSGVNLKLNNCSVVLTGSIRQGPGTIDAGNSTITLQGACQGIFSSDNLNNVIIGDVTSDPAYPYLVSSYIKSITNSFQPVAVTFSGDTTFGTFNLNGTSGNLVTMRTPGSTRTLTKHSAWNVGNSVDGGNNSGINFLSSGLGNNNYLSISNIIGVYTPAVTTRLFSTGILAIDNTMQFDEISQSTASIQSTVVYSSLFDEVSQTAVPMRILSNGSIQVSNIFDEVTGVS